jgi:hypothetical protein
MLIARKRFRENINIYLNNRLEQVEKIKYLGIYFDNKINFHKYIGNITEKTRKIIHMIGKTAKLNWGLGHKVLKIIYEGAIVPLMTYGAPVWEAAVNKQTHLRKLQSTQRLINIKIFKAYRTISYETSCVMAGAPTIGIVIAGKGQLYKIKQGLEKCEQTCDLLLPPNEWPHPAQRVTITETNEMTKYSIEIYTDGSKDERQVGVGVTIYSNK